MSLFISPKDSSFIVSYFRVINNLYMSTDSQLFLFISSNFVWKFVRNVRVEILMRILITLCLLIIRLILFYAMKIEYLFIV